MNWQVGQSGCADWASLTLCSHGTLDPAYSSEVQTVGHLGPKVFRALEPCPLVQCHLPPRGKAPAGIKVSAEHSRP